jgi:hypothetical protein
MKNLLLNRFQGAFLGANIIYIDRQQIILNRLVIETTPVIMAGINRLICPENFDPKKWVENIFSNVPSPDRAILAMLPLMLFFHDDRVKLREILIDVSHAWQLDWETCSSAVAIGYIISRSLTESFDPRSIITQLLDEMTNFHPILFQELSTIFPWRVSTNESFVGGSGASALSLASHLEHRSHSLSQLTHRLASSTHPIIAPTVIAIYCFLSTPEDFSISIRRAYHTEDRSGLTCALTGILAGVQNSSIGIPLNGDLATQERSQWLLAAEKLLAAWAGVYQEPSSSIQSVALLPASSQPTFANHFSVAASQTIQRRN